MKSIQPLSVEQFLEEHQSSGQLFLGVAGSGIISFDSYEFKSPAPALAAPAEKTAGSRIFTLQISTADVDRKGHRLNPHGCDLEAYKANPVLMWNHEGYSNPNAIIGKALSITQTDAGITAVVEYASLTGNPLPEQLFELETKGLLPGNSIGLRPTGQIFRHPDGTTTIGEWELIDISKVAIPVNGRATNKLIQPT